MFLLNRGGRKPFSDTIDHVGGEVLLPYGKTRPALERLAPEYESKLLDPQLYLAHLSAADCEKACTRLSTYPWFGVDGLPSFEESEGIRVWERSVRERIRRVWRGAPPSEATAIASASYEAVAFQARLGVSQVILASPLVLERENEGAIQAQWLDAGIDAARGQGIRQQVLATVAVHEAALNEAAFRPAGFLDGIIDQITSRDGVDGVYIVIAQEGTAGHPFQTDKRVHRAYLHFVRAFAEREYRTIITNFADVFGLVCLGTGATGLASGATQSLRRLTLDGFQERGGRGALPQFYSHRCIGEFLPERHLSDVIASKRGALRMVKDVTPYSALLIDALQRGGTAANIPTWAESMGNVQQARKHFVARVAEEARALSRMRTDSDRMTHVREWLEDATAAMLFLRDRFGSASLPGKFAPASAWLDMLEQPA